MNTALMIKIPRHWYHIFHDFCLYYIHSQNHIFCSAFLETLITYEYYSLNSYCKTVTDVVSFGALVTYTHYSDVIMSVIASQITSLTIIYSTVYSDTDQRKHQSSAALSFVRGIHRWPGNSPQKGPVTRKIMIFCIHTVYLVVTVSTTGCHKRSVCLSSCGCVGEVDLWTEIHFIPDFLSLLCKLSSIFV